MTKNNLCSHKCSKCLYFYVTECIKHEDIYNALSGAYESWPIGSELKPVCGVYSNSVVLDTDRGICQNYKEKQ